MKRATFTCLPQPVLIDTSFAVGVCKKVYNNRSWDTCKFTWEMYSAIHSSQPDDLFASDLLVVAIMLADSGAVRPLLLRTK